MRVLITGGAGYVGSTLAQALLAGGEKVRVLDCLLHGGRSLLGMWGHPAFEFIRGDVRDREAVRAAIDGVDAVVHLAAIVGDPACAQAPEEALSINVGGALTVYEQAKEQGVRRFVFASTCSNYGKMKDPNGYVDERSELAPVSLYAESKVNVERAILGDRPADGFAATCLRFATVFGVSPRMRFDLTVNEFTLEMVRNKRLKVYGEQFWRPYVHVTDVARAVVGVLRAPREQVRGEVYNVGSTELNFTKGMIVQQILRHVPDAQIDYVKKAEDPRDYRVSFAKIAETMGFCCRRTLDNGISEVAELVRSAVISDFESPEYRNVN